MGLKKQEKQAMLLSTLYAQYEEYLRTDKPLSATTVKNYLCRLRTFLRALPPDAPLSEMSKQAISKHLARVHATSTLAVRMHFSAIRRFTRWLVSEEWLRDDLCKDIPLPKVRYNRRETVPDDAVSRLWEACDCLPRSEYRSALAKAVFAVFIFGGVRRGEILTIRLDDLRVERGEIYIRRGKGGKPRPVFLPKEATDALREYLKLRPDCRHACLFAQSSEVAVGYNYIERLLLDLHRVAGIGVNYTAHQLRHAYASRMARNGVPLPVIQAALGHSRLDTTAQYLHTNEDDLMAAAHRASLGVVKEKTAPPPAAKREEKRFRVRRLR